MTGLRGLSGNELVGKITASVEQAGKLALVNTIWNKPSYPFKQVCEICIVH